jgi:hypothetical protein
LRRHFDPMLQEVEVRSIFLAPPMWFPLKFNNFESLCGNFVFQYYQRT